RTHLRRRRDEVLKVVEHEQDLLAIEVPAQCIGGALVRGFLRAKRLSDRAEHERRITERRERHEKHAVLESLDRFSREPDRQTRLSSASRSGQGQEADIPLMQEDAQLVQLTSTADELADVGQKVGIADAPQGRKARLQIRREHLKEPFRVWQILQAVLAEIADR